jgi:hypothetical protein
MQPQHNYVLRATIALALAAFVAGCNSTTKTAETAKPKAEKAAVAEPEYERTTSLGSWIPQKRRKNAPKTDSASQEVSPDSMDKLNEAGRSMGTRGLSPTN